MLQEVLLSPAAGIGAGGDNLGRLLDDANAGIHGCRQGIHGVARLHHECVGKRILTGPGRIRYDRRGHLHFLARLVIAEDVVGENAERAIARVAHISWHIDLGDDVGRITPNLIVVGDVNDFELRFLDGHGWCPGAG